MISPLQCLEGAEAQSSNIALTRQNPTLIIMLLQRKLPLPGITQAGLFYSSLCPLVCFVQSFNARLKTRFDCISWVPLFFIIFPFYPPYYTGFLCFVHEHSFDAISLGICVRAFTQGSWWFSPFSRRIIGFSTLLFHTFGSVPSYRQGPVGWHIVSHTLILSRACWLTYRHLHPHIIQGPLVDILSAMPSYHPGLIGWHLVSHTLIPSRVRWLTSHQPCPRTSRVCWLTSHQPCPPPIRVHWLTSRQPRLLPSGFVAWHLARQSRPPAIRVRWLAPCQPHPPTIQGSLAGISSAMPSYYPGFVGWNLVSRALIHPGFVSWHLFSCALIHPVFVGGTSSVWPRLHTFRVSQLIWSLRPHILGFVGCLLIGFVGWHIVWPAMPSYIQGSSVDSFTAPSYIVVGFVGWHVVWSTTIHSTFRVCQLNCLLVTAHLFILSIVVCFLLALLALPLLVVTGSGSVHTHVFHVNILFIFTLPLLLLSPLHPYSIPYIQNTWLVLSTLSYVCLHQGHSHLSSHSNSCRVHMLISMFLPLFISSYVKKLMDISCWAANCAIILSMFCTLLVADIDVQPKAASESLRETTLLFWIPSLLTSFKLSYFYQLLRVRVHAHVLGSNMSSCHH